MIRKTLSSLMLAVLFASPALADQQPTFAAVQKLEKSEVAAIGRICQGVKMKTLSYAIRCYSVSSGLNNCLFLAVNAATYRDLKNKGKTTYPELKAELDTANGTTVISEENGLSLTEAAPANLSPVRLLHDIYNRCTSYVTIH